MKPWPMKAWRALPLAPSVSSTLVAMTMTPASRALLDDVVEGLVVDDRGDQRIRLGGERGLHVGDLLLGIEPSVCVKIIWQFAWILRAGIVEALLHRLPEGVRRRRMDGEDDVERLGAGDRRRRRAAPSERQRSQSVSVSHVIPPLVESSMSSRRVGARERRTVAREPSVEVRDRAPARAPGPGGTVIMPSFTSGSAVTRSRYQVR